MADIPETQEAPLLSPLSLPIPKASGVVSPVVSLSPPESVLTEKSMPFRRLRLPRGDLAARCGRMAEESGVADGDAQQGIALLSNKPKYYGRLLILEIQMTKHGILQSWQVAPCLLRRPRLHLNRQTQ